MSNQKEVAFVSSASIAAQLDVILDVAKDMSISVKNAKAIANRAGAKARGFSPITDFINDMSLETMRIVSDINQQSVKLSQVAMQELRAREALAHFKKAHELAAQSPYLGQFLQTSQSLEIQKKERHDELLKYGRTLRESMEEISRYMAVAKVIVSNSRIEAVNADEYRANLEDIANDIESACNVIREQIKNSQNRLENAMQQWKLEA